MQQYKHNNIIASEATFRIEIDVICIIMVCVTSRVKSLLVLVSA